MKKVFKLKDLDCACCADKMQVAINGIPGVLRAINRNMTQRLTVEAPEEQMDAIMDEAVKRCKKIEPDCTIVR